MRPAASGRWASAKIQSPKSKLRIQDVRKARSSADESFHREYIKITKSYTLAAAKALEQNATPDRPFNFVLVSGDGSTFTPGALTPLFGRVKGETELALAAMRKANPQFRASTVRPSFVDAASHEAIKPYIPEPPFSQRAAVGVLGPVIRGFGKSRWSPTEPLGKFLVGMAQATWEAQGKLEGKGLEKVGDFPVVENTAIRRVMGLA